MNENASSSPVLSLGWWTFIMLAMLLAAGVLLMILPITAPSASSRVLRTTRALPAFVSITTADVTPAAVANAPDDALSPDDLTGRVTTAALPEESILPASNTVTLPAGWQIVAAPITSGLTPSPGETLTLMGLTDAGKPEVLSERAIALGVDGDLTVLALPPDETESVLPYLTGKDKLLLVRTLPAPSPTPTPAP